MNKYLIDTSMLVEFFDGTELGTHVCSLTEEDVAIVSSLSIAEFTDIAARRGMSIASQLSFIEQKFHILPLSTASCMQVGKIKNEQRKKQSSFGLIDALIYLTAQEHNLILLTKDNDFKGLKGVEIV